MIAVHQIIPSHTSSDPFSGQIFSFRNSGHLNLSTDRTDDDGWTVDASCRQARSSNTVSGVIITLSDLTLFISCDDKSIEFVDN